MAPRKTHIPKRRSNARNRRATPLRGASKRKKNSGILAFFSSASSRAQSRSNQRNWKSREMKSIKASIAQPAEDEFNLPFLHLILRTIVGIFLIFPCLISTLAIFEIPNTNSVYTNSWHHLFRADAFLYFTVGCFLMSGWFWTKLFRKHFLYLYVLGHELTHAFFIILCGGKISEFDVSSDGGFVMTNKTNVLIALSPYFVPFWTCVTLALSYIIRLFIDIPMHNEILYSLIGFTWTFHLAWTIWMIPRDQPDLKENGTFFSLTIIYLANILLLAVLLCLSPSGITFKSYCYQWINLFIENSLSLISWLKAL